jgi:hypothetical protein
MVMNFQIYACPSQCIATPSTNGTISMVAVEAYQLLVLVSLIADGQVLFPRASNPSIFLPPLAVD